MAGLFCGAALECLAIESLPVGASRYPEWGTASVVAGALAANGATPAGVPTPSTFVMAVICGITTAWVGGWSMFWLRRLISAFARPRLEQLSRGNRRTVTGLQVFGMTADFARAALLALLAYVPSRALCGIAYSHWSVADGPTRAVVITSVAAVAARAVWNDFHAITGTRRLFLASLAAGTLLVALGV